MPTYTVRQHHHSTQLKNVVWYDGAISPIRLLEIYAKTKKLF